MNPAGTWVVTQTWNGVPSYKFNAQLGADGTVAVDGGFFGTWTVLGSSNQISLAIANFGQNSVTCYNGNIAGPIMGGQMTGGSPGGKIFQGVWGAVQTQHDQAPQGTLSLPSKS